MSRWDRATIWLLGVGTILWGRDAANYSGTLGTDKPYSFLWFEIPGGSWWILGALVALWIASILYSVRAIWRGVD